MHLITADGGFDFSIDFNKQEEIGFNLIFAQVCYALTMQKHNGHFILKFSIVLQNQEGFNIYFRIHYIAKYEI